MPRFTYRGNYWGVGIPVVSDRYGAAVAVHIDNLSEVRECKGVNEMKPITPADVIATKSLQIPDLVIETFNQLIAEYWDGTESQVLQSAVMAALVARCRERGDIFDNHWLDVKDIYRAEGWEVEYNKPAYYDSYEPMFIFRPRKPR